MAHHILQYATAIKYEKLTIGRDGLLWWKDLSVPPTRADKDILFNIVSAYELQARNPQQQTIYIK